MGYAFQEALEFASNIGQRVDQVWMIGRSLDSCMNAPLNAFTSITPMLGAMISTAPRLNVLINGFNVKLFAEIPHRLSLLVWLLMVTQNTKENRKRTLE